jgi:hypothetical protein
MVRISAMISVVIVSLVGATNAAASADGLGKADVNVTPNQQHGDDAADKSSMSKARMLFRNHQYSAARDVVHPLGDFSKHRNVADEASFLEAECLFCQEQYTSAAFAYCEYLSDFPAAAHREEALRRALDIADYLLDPTRCDLRAGRVEPSYFEAMFTLLKVDEPRLFWNRRQQALYVLEQVVFMDGLAPTSAEAGLKAGIVRLALGQDEDAILCLRLVVYHHPESERAVEAKRLLAAAARFQRAGRTDAELRVLRSDPVIQKELLHSGAKRLQMALDAARSRKEAP